MFLKTAPHKNPGFTLVELLVVITVVAILIAMLLPSLKEARDTAKSASCLANVRSLALSAMAYGNDWKNSCVPQVIYGQAFNYAPPASEKRVMGTHRWAYWADALYPYLNYDSSALDCATGAVRLNTQRSPFAYAVTPFIYPVDSSGARISTDLYTIDEFRNPSDKIYFADSGYSLLNGATPTAMHHFSPYFSVSRSTASDNRASPATRHNSRGSRVDVVGSGPNVACGFNAAMFDGHATYKDWRTTFPNIFSAGGSALDRSIRTTYWQP